MTYQTPTKRLSELEAKIRTFPHYVEVNTEVEAREMLLWCQREFPDVAFVEVKRGGYEFFVYNEAGRLNLAGAIGKWYHKDSERLENDVRILHVLGFRPPG